LQLIIAGSGEEEKNLQKLVSKLKLQDMIKFTGRVSEEQKIKLMQSAWVFVNPSFMEGWGITTIEANACGTPVIASNVPGLKDSVKNPTTGYLVEYGNTTEFAEALRSVLLNNEERKRLQKGAITWAQNFDWNKNCLLSLEILNGKI